MVEFVSIVESKYIKDERAKDDLSYWYYNYSQVWRGSTLFLPEILSCIISWLTIHYLIPFQQKFRSFQVFLSIWWVSVWGSQDMHDGIQNETQIPSECIPCMVQAIHLMLSLTVPRWPASEFIEGGFPEKITGFGVWHWDQPQIIAL